MEVGMIRVTRLDGRSVVVNADRIEWMEAIPDTILCFESEHRMVVRESLQEIIQRVIDYKCQIHASPQVIE
jgi:flagellar protein FlbD